MCVGEDVAASPGGRVPFLHFHSSAGDVCDHAARPRLAVSQSAPTHTLTPTIIDPTLRHTPLRFPAADFSKRDKPESLT